MALTQPILPFLRPLGPPRASTLRHLIRFSTSARSRAESSSKESTGTDASPQPSPTSAPPSPPTKPKPSPATPDQSPPTSSQPSSTAAPPAHTSRPSRTVEPRSSPEPTSDASPVENHKLSYHVSRTPSAQLPVYKLAKRGGNLHQTRVRKISGNIKALAEDLRAWLVQQGVSRERMEMQINEVAQQVIVKGWHKDKIIQFLESKRF